MLLDQMLRASTRQRLPVLHRVSGLPVRNLEQLSKCYHTQYRLYFLENLAVIQEHGELALLDALNERHACQDCGELRSIQTGSASPAG